MTDSRTVDVQIDPYDYTTEIRVNLRLSCAVPFSSQYFTNLRCIGILLSHTHAHYTVIRVSSFVLLSR